jgi:hemerythrin-like domain-containing protein
MLQPNPLFDQLISEHEEVKQLLREAEDCEESERPDLLTQIEEALIPHARGEEKTLYAMMNQRATEEEAKDLTAEAYEEHQMADKLLADIKATDTSDDQWLAKLKVLKENVEHHIREEESELFEKARKVFEASEFEALLTAYQNSKEQYSETLPTQNQIQSRTPTQSLEL